MLQTLDVKSILTNLVDAFHKPQDLPCWIRVTNLVRFFCTVGAPEHAFYKRRCPAGFPSGFSPRQQGMLSLQVIRGVFIYNHGILMNFDKFDEFRMMMHNDVQYYCMIFHESSWYCLNSSMFHVFPCPQKGSERHRTDW